ILQRAILLALLGVNLGQVIVEPGTFLDGPLLQQHAVSVAMLEDLGVELESRVVSFPSLFIFFLAEIGGAQVAVNGSGGGRQLPRALVAAGGFAIAFFRVVDGSQIVNGFWVFRIQTDSAPVALHGRIQLHHLVISDAQKPLTIWEPSTTRK